jgi:hypothetical protein
MLWRVITAAIVADYAGLSRIERVFAAEAVSFPYDRQLL